ncbi:MAG: TlpA disulfide reductase family protein [Chloroflexota bacterium]
MKKQTGILNLLIMAGLLLAACAPVADADTPAGSMNEQVQPSPVVAQQSNPAPPEKAMDDSMKNEPTQDSTSGKEDADGEDAESGQGAGMVLPAWFTVSLTNAATGEAFTIDSFKGKVILVETMAQWCSNCLKQQKEVKALHDLLGERDDFISLGLDIDPNEDAATLKDYIARNGFDWVYAVAPADVSRALSDLYGAQFLSPPSTPMLIIDRQGEVHPLPMGIKSADRLKEFLQPFLDEEM